MKEILQYNDKITIEEHNLENTTSSKYVSNKNLLIIRTAMLLFCLSVFCLYYFVDNQNTDSSTLLLYLSTLSYIGLILYLGMTILLFISEYLEYQKDFNLKLTHIILYELAFVFSFSTTFIYWFVLFLFYSDIREVFFNSHLHQFIVISSHGINIAFLIIDFILNNNTIIPWKHINITYLTLGSYYALVLFVSRYNDTLPYPFMDPSDKLVLSSTLVVMVLIFSLFFCLTKFLHNMKFLKYEIRYKQLEKLDKMISESILHF